jgi:HD-like signal output (HDOD) protein
MRIAAEIPVLHKESGRRRCRICPPYRPVARKLMLLTSLEDVPLTRVQEVLRTDAPFAAELLKLASSPLIGMRGEISSILQASRSWDWSGSRAWQQPCSRVHF